MTEESPIAIRRPYRGSCHCGHIKYIVFLTLPPAAVTIKASPESTVRIRKCNCSTCHKMGFFHVRLQDSPNDFVLLSPVDPETQLLDYTCFDKRIHWYFCGKCGVRCFAFAGEGEISEVDLDKMEGKKEPKGLLKKVWKPKAENWIEGKTGYLSVNATTLEPEQQGLDLREWTEKQWITYLDVLHSVRKEDSFVPHEGGMY